MKEKEHNIPSDGDLEIIAEDFVTNNEHLIPLNKETLDDEYLKDIITDFGYDEFSNEEQKDEFRNWLLEASDNLLRQIKEDCSLQLTNDLESIIYDTDEQLTNMDKVKILISIANNLFDETD